MRQTGKILRCDRCGKSVVLKALDDKVLDGGFTRLPRYEEEPMDWERLQMGRLQKNDIGLDLCADCAKDIREILSVEFGSAV